MEPHLRHYIRFMYRWMTTIRLSRLILLLICLLIILPLLTHYYIIRYISDGPSTIGHNEMLEKTEDKRRSIKSATFDEVEALQKVSDLNLRIKEMMRIRSSVSNELRSLESKRQRLQTDITSLNSKLELLKLQLGKKQLELDRVHMSLEQAQYAQKEATMKNQPFIARPVQLLPEDIPFYSSGAKHSGGKFDRKTWKNCRMHNCFDYSRCSLTSGFPVFVYLPENDIYSDNEINDSQLRLAKERNQLNSDIMNAFNSNPHVTYDPTVACIYVIILFKHNYKNISSDIESYLQSLPNWGGEGLNHVLINVMPDIDLLEFVDPRKSLVIQNQFNERTFRSNFDVVLPSLDSKFIINENPPQCPARRNYLLSYHGYIKQSERNAKFFRIITVLKRIESEPTNDLFKFDFDCMDPCANHQDTLIESTFAIIFPPYQSDRLSSRVINKRLCAILAAGAVPVLIGGDYIKLPFHDVIDWRKAVLHLPFARITELHFLLKSFNDADILEMRKYGRLFYERFLSNTQSIVDSLLALIRQSRLQIPAPPSVDEPSVPLFNATFPMKFYDTPESAVSPDSAEPDENLGPIEPPFSTPSYQRNYSTTLSQGYVLWNEVIMDPFFSYPFTPFDPILPSEAKFIGSSYGFRPIGGGSGGAGKEFSEALGGNVPKEQFTIVMLTYEREAVLIDSLQRLKGLPHLNKIMVIWNSPMRLPSPELRWPDVGVPIQVMRSKKNSLNNRFLPYHEIQTEAVLSMDDDAHLRHDEIIFGFRVWRESRDRIVGFPGRFHSFDVNHNAWLYNSNYSCELSMVLTGAAFFHKYYAYLYSYSMKSSIREKVDEYMNCEDIAMNFLVSHVTRKPPIKVTSRWTFRCPGCPVSLSEDDSHFQERHKCINFFTSIFGYNPLLNTQFRADSVLFKTRIPHDKQKCFKFI